MNVGSNYWLEIPKLKNLHLQHYPSSTITELLPQISGISSIVEKALPTKTTKTPLFFFALLATSLLVFLCRITIPSILITRFLLTFFYVICLLLVISTVVYPSIPLMLSTPYKHEYALCKITLLLKSRFFKHIPALVYNYYLVIC